MPGLYQLNNFTEIGYQTDNYSLSDKVIHGSPSSDTETLLVIHVLGSVNLNNVVARNL